MRPSLTDRVASVLVTAAASCAMAGCTTGSIRVSAAQDAASAGMVDVAALAPGIRIDMRYAGSENFVGTPIDGYQASRCYLHREVAEALARVQASVEAQGQSLVVFDCYRPVQAVQHFVRWARDPGDQKNKARYYPAIDKARLFEAGYIAEQSGHSRGGTVDLGLLACGANGECEALDMGTGYDLFDARSHTDSPSVTPGQQANRQRLRETMSREGFANYPKEWWHFTLKPEPTPATAYDFPVR